MKILAISLGVVILILLGVFAFVQPSQKAAAPIATVAASPDGRVRIVSPVANSLIASPAVILGTVTGGGWFFEGTFPVKILDGDGAMLGHGQAEAQGDWESRGTVPFTATISFASPHFATGSIVFSKDNPSGSANNAEVFSLPVRFQ